MLGQMIDQAGVARLVLEAELHVVRVIYNAARLVVAIVPLAAAGEHLKDALGEQGSPVLKTALLRAALDFRFAIWLRFRASCMRWHLSKSELLLSEGQSVELVSQ